MKQITARATTFAPNHIAIRTDDENWTPESVCFQSYDSVVLVFDFKERTFTFGRDWDYSRTTMKRLGEFLRSSYIPGGARCAVFPCGIINAAAIRKAIACGAAAYDPELV